MPTLALDDVTVRRGPGAVVRGLTVEIRDGAVFWITGPNGAGKTSLLRVVAGLDAPAAGAVRSDPGLRLRYFHSEMTLPAWSAVAAWDRLFARLAPAAHPATDVRPGLSPGRRVGRLSTGERKRLLLDPLLRVPGSLLLDEPYEHLSPDAKVALSRRLRERARTDIVVVVTNQTHRDPGEPGLRLEAGAAEPLGAVGSEGRVRP